MRIALFSDTFFPKIDGVVNVVHELATALAKRGNDVCVVAISQESAASLIKRMNLQYQLILLPSLQMPLYPGTRLAIPGASVFRQVKEFNPDIIHSHTPFPVGTLARRYARRLDVPLVGTHHTFYNLYLKLWHLDYPWARTLSWRITNKYYNQCAILVSPSHALADGMVRHGLSIPTEIIPNPVSLDAFKPADAWPPEEALRPYGPTVVYMGRLSCEKDIENVIRAAKLVMKKRDHDCPDAQKMRLVIIGGGPYQKELEQFARLQGIRDRIIFTGFLRGADLARELCLHMVFVTASTTENQPVSVLEAMASGLPVVAVSALGMPEIVRYGINGFLVPPGDTDAMAASILKIIYDDASRKKFAAASRELALLHDPDRIAAHHEELYRKLIYKTE